MKELIKEAETLREKLLEVMLNIPYDFEPDYTIAITLTADFLKKIIERKDNIVDLGEVWHEVNNEPNDESRILIIDDKDDWYSLNHKGYKDNDKHWESVVRAFGMAKWAYLEDLLPKGGEVWNTTK